MGSLKVSTISRLGRVKHQKHTEPDNLILWLDAAGRRAGIGDWRPRRSGGDHGRLGLESVGDLA